MVSFPNSGFKLNCTGMPVRFEKAGRDRETQVERDVTRRVNILIEKDLSAVGEPMAKELGTKQVVKLVKARLEREVRKTSGRAGVVVDEGLSKRSIIDRTSEIGLKIRELRANQKEANEQAKTESSLWAWVPGVGETSKQTAERLEAEILELREQRIGLQELRVLMMLKEALSPKAEDLPVVSHEAIAAAGMEAHDQAFVACLENLFSGEAVEKRDAQAEKVFLERSTQEKRLKVALEYTESVKEMGEVLVEDMAMQIESVIALAMIMEQPGGKEKVLARLGEDSQLRGLVESYGRGENTLLNGIIESYKKGGMNQVLSDWDESSVLYSSSALLSVIDSMESAAGWYDTYEKNGVLGVCTAMGAMAGNATAEFLMESTSLLGDGMVGAPDEFYDEETVVLEDEAKSDVASLWSWQNLTGVGTVSREVAKTAIVGARHLPQTVSLGMRGYQYYLDPKNLVRDAQSYIKDRHVGVKAEHDALMELLDEADASEGKREQVGRIHSNMQHALVGWTSSAAMRTFESGAQLYWLVQKSSAGEQGLTPDRFAAICEAYQRGYLEEFEEGSEEYQLMEKAEKLGVGPFIQETSVEDLKEYYRKYQDPEGGVGALKVEMAKASVAVVKKLGRTVAEEMSHIEEDLGEGSGGIADAAEQAAAKSAARAARSNVEAIGDLGKEAKDVLELGPKQEASKVAEPPKAKAEDVHSKQLKAAQAMTADVKEMGKVLAEDMSMRMKSLISLAMILEKDGGQKRLLENLSPNSEFHRLVSSYANGEKTVLNGIIRSYKGQPGGMKQVLADWDQSTMLFSSSSLQGALDSVEGIVNLYDAYEKKGAVGVVDSTEEAALKMMDQRIRHLDSVADEATARAGGEVVDEKSSVTALSPLRFEGLSSDVDRVIQVAKTCLPRATDMYRLSSTREPEHLVRDVKESLQRFHDDVKSQQEELMWLLTPEQKGQVEQINSNMQKALTDWTSSNTMRSFESGAKLYQLAQKASEGKNGLTPDTFSGICRLYKEGSLTEKMAGYEFMHEAEQLGLGPYIEETDLDTLKECFEKYQKGGEGALKVEIARASVAVIKRLGKAVADEVGQIKQDLNVVKLLEGESIGEAASRASEKAAKRAAEQKSVSTENLKGEVERVLLKQVDEVSASLEGGNLKTMLGRDVLLEGVMGTVIKNYVKEITGKFDDLKGELSEKLGKGEITDSDYSIQLERIRSEANVELKKAWDLYRMSSGWIAGSTVDVLVNNAAKNIAAACSKENFPKLVAVGFQDVADTLEKIYPESGENVTARDLLLQMGCSKLHREKWVEPGSTEKWGAKTYVLQNKGEVLDLEKVSDATDEDIAEAYKNQVSRNIRDRMGQLLADQTGRFAKEKGLVGSASLGLLEKVFGLLWVGEGLVLAPVTKAAHSGASSAASSLETLLDPPSQGGENGLLAMMGKVLGKEVADKYLKESGIEDRLAAMGSKGDILYYHMVDKMVSQLVESAKNGPAPAKEGDPDGADVLKGSLEAMFVGYNRMLGYETLGEMEKGVLDSLEGAIVETLPKVLERQREGIASFLEGTNEESPERRAAFAKQDLRLNLPLPQIPEGGEQTGLEVAKAFEKKFANPQGAGVSFASALDPITGEPAWKPAVNILTGLFGGLFGFVRGLFGRFRDKGNSDK